MIDELIVKRRLAYSAAEAGLLIGGIDDVTVRRLVGRGHLKRVPHTGDRVLIAHAELERFVAAGVTDSDPTPPHGIARPSITTTEGQTHQ